MSPIERVARCVVLYGHPLYCWSACLGSRWVWVRASSEIFLFARVRILLANPSAAHTPTLACNRPSGLRVPRGGCGVLRALNTDVARGPAPCRAVRPLSDNTRLEPPMDAPKRQRPA